MKNLKGIFDLNHVEYNGSVGVNLSPYFCTLAPCSRLPSSPVVPTVPQPHQSWYCCSDFHTSFRLRALALAVPPAEGTPWIFV